ncbi:SurA N-terminal domain-containing protein [Pseudonocardia endophytica]|uniref:SurA N-terminal domain-containing protein n=1 Tax=Pseudonocardia endophytica TaxID=401976 RepID=UPI0014051F0D|nr:SurA N-terminal domain-containing protein [Pseudonocardia endophytica]
MRTRTGRLLAGAAIVVALVSGCGSTPSKVDAAAVIGDDTVTLSDVQPRITAALARPDLVSTLKSQGYGPPDIGRAIVSQVVLHDLLGRAAAQQQIVVSDDEVNAAIAQAGGEQVLAQSTLDAGGVRERITDQLIATKLAEREIDRLSVTADIAVVQSRDEALTLARAIAAGGPAADRALATAATAQRNQQIRPATTPQAAATPLIGIPAGSTAAFPISSQQGWVVVRVTERRTDAPPAGPATASRLDPQTLSEAGIRLLTPVAAQAGVEVSPRYGTWDPVTLSVVPNADQAGELLPSASAG